MANTYRINFDTLRHEGLKEVFTSIEKAMSALNIDFYLIGALARDTWFAQNNIRALGTKDIDFAVLISDDAQYAKLKTHLVQQEGFTEAKNNEYCLIDRSGNEIDLLPFGALEIESSKVADSAGIVRTDITGFKEIYEQATEEVNFEDVHSFKVSTLEGIVILKLIAYDDRPEIRNSDIKDIVAILAHYFDLRSDLIYEKHNDLFLEEDLDLPQVAAVALGREMGHVLNSNETLRNRIISILDKHTENNKDAPAANLMTAAGIADIETAIGLLKQIKKGIRKSGETTTDQ